MRPGRRTQVAPHVCGEYEVRVQRGPVLSRFPQHGVSHPLQVLTTALREEGPRFLFKGWTPAFIRLGPNTVLMFVFFEVRAVCRIRLISQLIIAVQQLKKGWRTLFPATYLTDSG